MDAADEAQKLEQMNIDKALSKRNQTLPFTGLCHYCTEAVEAGNFCDADCRDDFEQINRGK
jgi:hypothetical protein